MANTNRRSSRQAAPQMRHAVQYNAMHTTAYRHRQHSLSQQQRQATIAIAIVGRSTSHALIHGATPCAVHSAILPPCHPATVPSCIHPAAAVAPLGFQAHAHAFTVTFHLELTPHTINFHASQPPDHPTFRAHAARPPRSPSAVRNSEANRMPARTIRGGTRTLPRVSVRRRHTERRV